MSYAAERWARAQRVGNARAKQVLVELANCHNGKTGKCTPGIKYLHEVTELKEDTISTATNFLQSKGFIKKTYVAVEKGRAISYELLGFNPQEWERKKTEDSTENGLTPNRGNPESVGTPETGATDSPENGGTGTPEFGGETGNKNRERNREVMCAPSGAPQPPEMSDDEIADLLESVPQEKGERPPFEKGAHLSEKGDHPSPAPKRRATPRRKTSTPCPFDMESSIPDEYLEIAKKAGIGDPQRVFSSFVAHAVANGRRLIVWPAGFRNWCDNELKWHPDQKPKITPQSQKTAKDYEWI